MIGIPPSVVRLGADCFDGATRLCSVGFSKTSELSAIEDRAFQRCSSLDSIAVPDAVTRLGVECFAFCERLREVRFGVESRLSEIGDLAFQCCGTIKRIEIPGTVKIVGDQCFAFCRSLKSVIVANGRESRTVFGHGAFRRCPALRCLPPAEDGSE
jgi:hypothetical protein